MRVLLVPMAAMAETSGSFSRVKIIEEALRSSGVKTALCAARDMNYRDIEGVKSYELPVPSPMGLPMAIARHTFPVAEKLGITSRKTVSSFEEVLFLTGNLNYGYLKRSLEALLKAIDDFKPDVIYSEFSIAAMTAALKNGIRLFATVSEPTQSEYASSPRYSRDLNRILRENDIPEVVSALDLVKRADKRFVPSIRALEDFGGEDVIYLGSLKKRPSFEPSVRDKILVYMGNGTISRDRMQKEIRTAFDGSGYDVYIAGKGLLSLDEAGFHTAERFDFVSLLPETLLFINHGGQNSVIDGLIYNVPQLICPGKVFERIFNADSIVRNGAGIKIDPEEFDHGSIKRLADNITGDPAFAANAAKLGSELMSSGGTDLIVNEL